MLNKLSNIIANYLIILSNTDTDDAQKDVYAYGIECFLNTAITVSILCLWGMITHTFSETVIWLISFTLLRHYVGGYHAPSNLSCILSSVLLGASNYFIPNFLLNEFLTLCLYSFLLVICWFFAPVKNYQKKLLAKGRFYNKFHSLFLLFAEYFFHFFLPKSIYLTYTYAVVCCIILMLIRILQDSHNAEVDL